MKKNTSHHNHWAASAKKIMGAFPAFFPGPISAMDSPSPKRFGFIDRVSFFYKLAAAFMLVVTLTVAGLSLYTYTLECSNAVAQEKSSLRAVSAKIAADIDTYLATQENLINYLAVSEELNNFFLEPRPAARQYDALNHWLQTRIAISPGFNTVYLLNSQGRCIASTDPSFLDNDYSFRNYFKEPMKGRFNKSDWTVGLVSKTPGIYLSAPIVTGSTVAGVLVVKLKVDRIFELISFWKIQNKDAYLLNGSGVLLAHIQPKFNYHSLVALTPQQKSVIDQDRQFAGMPIDSIGLPKLRQVSELALASGSGKFAEYRFLGDDRIAALTPLKEKNWVVGVSAPKASYLAISRSILRKTLILSLLAIVAAGSVGLLIGSFIYKPILRLTEKLDLFGRGLAEVRAEVDSADEIGRLAASFNRMADTIDKQTHSMQQKTLELERLNQELKNISIRDPLTGCYNRRYLHENLEKELLRGERFGLWLTVIMCDIDHFKKVNDSYGHLAGDLVLKILPQLLRERTRDGVDWTVRYGGEEFLLVLPETDLEGGRILAERLRSSFAALPIRIDDEHEIHLSASFGVASVDFSAGGGKITPEMLTAAADALLYGAKEAGRNRVLAEELRIEGERSPKFTKSALIPCSLKPAISARTTLPVDAA